MGYLETTVKRKIAQKDLLSRRMMTNLRKFKQRSAQVAGELEEFMAWAETINVKWEIFRWLDWEQDWTYAY